jgi:Bacterial archaeo-eukaryotic release factor family 2
MTVTVKTQPNVPALVEVLRHGGRVASVYVGARPVEAGVEWEARWHALAAQLRGEGTAESITEELRHTIAQSSDIRATVGSTELAAFASTGGQPLLLRLPGLGQPDFASYAGPAHVLPVLAWLQQRPPYVLVVTDRTGADIAACADGGQPRHAWPVQGPDDEIERNAPGGPAQLRYQHRAEDSWRHNAGAVAQATALALKQTGARLLIVSGDVRAVQLLSERLPAWVQNTVTVRHISGSRSADGSQDSRPATVAAVVRAAADEVTAAQLTHFAEQRRPGGLAVEGEAATLAALARGQVATLLVTPRGAPADGRTAWFGAEPTQVQPATLPEPEGWTQSAAGPLVDVAVRAALLTGAQVRVLALDSPGAPADGIGALCRFH